jgi:hypothetical protein
MNTKNPNELQKIVIVFDRLISLAYLRFSKGVLYGDSMLPCRIICYQDTIKHLQSAITEVENLIISEDILGYDIRDFIKEGKPE